MGNLSGLWTQGCTLQCNDSQCQHPTLANVNVIPLSPGRLRDRETPQPFKAPVLFLQLLPRDLVRYAWVPVPVLATWYHSESRAAALVWATVTIACLTAAICSGAGCLSLTNPCLRCLTCFSGVSSCCLVVVSQGVAGRQAAASVCSKTVFTRLGICLLPLSHAEINTSFYFPQQLENIQEG